MRTLPDWIPGPEVLTVSAIVFVVCLFTWALVGSIPEPASTFPEGQTAHTAGVTPTANPYRTSPQAEQWLRGWVESAKTAKKKPPTEEPSYPPPHAKAPYSAWKASVENGYWWRQFVYLGPTGKVLHQYLIWSPMFGREWVYWYDPKDEFFWCRTATKYNEKWSPVLGVTYWAKALNDRKPRPKVTTELLAADWSVPIRDSLTPPSYWGGSTQFPDPPTDLPVSDTAEIPK